MSLSCRLLFDPPSDGAWNMAVDEVLLQDAAESGLATLRFYQWREPTLSLGYFQSHSDRQSHAASLACPLIRRASGGGAILHDRELTYSLSIPAAHPLARDAEGLYFAVHEIFVTLLGEALSSKRGALVLCPATVSRPAGEPFLCFNRRACGDVLWRTGGGVLTDHKICGSAQRRHEGAVLQHGSLLLGTSKHAPELLGIEKLASVNLPPERVADALAGRLADKLSFRLAPIEIKLFEADQRIDSVAETKFGRQNWTLKR